MIAHDPSPVTPGDDTQASTSTPPSLRRRRLLDLCCGAGGAGVGYHRAGFDVVGVDIAPQPNYPFEFHQGDALAYLLAHGRDFDAVHASFPCQASSAMTKGNRGRGRVDDHIDLNPAGRALLDAIGLPYVMENVQGSVLRRDLTLCGETFGLEVIRHRWFELGRWTMPQPAHVPHRGRVGGYRHGEKHAGPYVAVYGHRSGDRGSVADWQRAMGIDWTSSRRELAEAIPPAYTHFIGVHLLAHLDVVAALEMEDVAS